MILGFERFLKLCFQLIDYMNRIDDFCHVVSLVFLTIGFRQFRFAPCNYSYSPATRQAKILELDLKVRDHHRPLTPFPLLTGECPADYCRFFGDDGQV